MFGHKKSVRGAIEVNARSRPRRAQRLRLAVNALAISAGIVLFLMVAWKGSEWIVHEHVMRNPALAIDQIEIETDGIIPAKHLRAWAGVGLGTNALALDLRRIQRDLELVPLIESASVERYLPRRLVLRIREREPIARAVFFRPPEGGAFFEPAVFYLDREGMVIPEYARLLNARAFDAATKHLPRLEGLRPEEVRPGARIEHVPALAALRWLHEFRTSPMAGKEDVRAVDVSSGNVLAVTTAHGSEIIFAPNDFAPQFARWRGIVDLGRRHDRLLASLDLAVTNYVPVSWNSATNSPPASVEPRPASPYRKRHV